MASTYSTLAVQLMATGENTTTWGEVTNVNLGTAIEEAIVGSADVTFSSGNVTLSLTNTNSTQTARNMRLRCTGTTGGSTRNLIIPTTTGSPPATFEKPYIVQNDCADSIVVKTATGSGVTVPAGKSMWVYANGTDVVEVTTALGSPLSTSSGGTGTNVVTYCNLAANVNGTLPIANGGTGSNATTYCNVEVNVAGILPLANGGVGSNTQSGARSVLGAAASGSNGDITALTNAAGIQIGAPTGGAQGSGTLNATGLYVNGVAVGTGSGTVTSVSGTGSVNGLSLSGTVTSSGSITLSGSVTSVNNSATINSVLIGYRSIPRSTTSGTATTGDVGKCIAVSAGITIPNSTFAAGDAVSIYNTTSSAVTITQASGLTLRLAGTATTGNRTLAAYGVATVWFNTASEAVISGSVS